MESFPFITIIINNETNTSMWPSDKAFVVDLREAGHGSRGLDFLRPMTSKPLR